MKLCLNPTNASDKIFKDVHSTMHKYLHNLGYNLAENSILSLTSVKKSIGELTGVYSLLNDMCINTCMAYTGSFTNLEACLYCTESCYNLTIFAATNGLNKTPQWQFHTLPLGPQLQALWWNPEIANAICHHV
jgi:hypothetical protein